MEASASTPTLPNPEKKKPEDVLVYECNGELVNVNYGLLTAILRDHAKREAESKEKEKKETEDLRAKVAFLSLEFEKLKARVFQAGIALLAEK